MEVVETWTGRHANALRNALRLTNEAFAEALGTSVRAVAKWNANPNLVPVSELQRALDTALSRAPADAHARFGLLLASRDRESPNVHPSTGSPTGDDVYAANAQLRLDHDPDLNDVLDWLDDHAGWPDGEARQRVSTLAQQLDIRALRDGGRKRGRLSRMAIATALARFYDIESSDYELHQAWCGQAITTSVLTRPEWLDLRLVLGQGEDRLTLHPGTGPVIDRLDAATANAAAVRIAEVLSTDTRLVNRPLYQLVSHTVKQGAFTGTVALTDFGSYALTMDLLERELLDALVNGAEMTTATLPLRARYLPDVESVTNVDGRLCAGGPLALFAAARPRGHRRDERDYVLLVQERSSRVLNAARRLAVIPKAFHQPLIDFSDDAQISATLERELEEELLGRTDIDSTTAERRLADPLNIDRLSVPMRWLIERADSNHWRMECTGFGLNLVSGNFEFASLVVIDDEEWWKRFGGVVEANWESDGLRLYSSRDHDGLTSLLHDPAWSNEGLFSFTQGLRRLSETGGDRVSSPLTEQET